MLGMRFSLFRRGNRIYYIGYDDGARRRWKSTGAKRKSTALQVLASVDTAFCQPNPTVKLSRFQVEFLQYADTDFALHTIRIYRQAFRLFFGSSGDIRLDSLSPRHLDFYFSSRLKGGLSRNALNIEIRALKAAISTAVRWGYLLKNPFAGSKSLLVPRKSPVFFSREEFVALLKAIKDEWLRQPTLFSVCTGVRQAEAVNLTWGAVDLELAMRIM
jgi:integrase